MFPTKFDHFDWLSQVYTEWKQTSKLVNFQDFCWGMGFWSRFENERNFLILFHSSRKPEEIKFTFEFLSFWLTLTVSQWLKANFNINQVSGFLLRSMYVILVKIWKWLKLLNSFPFIKQTRGNYVYIRIWLFLMTFTVLQWMKTNFKISQLEDFC